MKVSINLDDKCYYIVPNCFTKKRLSAKSIKDYNKYYNRDKIIDLIKSPINILIKINAIILKVFLKG